MNEKLEALILCPECGHYYGVAFLRQMTSTIDGKTRLYAVYEEHCPHCGLSAWPLVKE